MTKIGLEHIANEIRSRVIYPPELPADKLVDWLNGYMACLDCVNEVMEPYLETILEGCGRMEDENDS